MHSSRVADEDRDDVSRSVSILLSNMEHRLRAFVAGAHGRPLLMTYGADGTPLSSVQTFTKQLGHRRIRRRGGSAGDWLCHMAFFRFLESDLASKSTVVLFEPWPLADKVSETCFVVTMHSIKLLRELGHRGIAIHHTVFDRAVYSSLRRMSDQYVEVRVAEVAETLEEPDRTMLPMLTWSVGSPCGIHDGHNSLKWALHGEFQDVDMLKEIHIALEAARNSYSLLVEHMVPWLVGCIQFVSPMDDTSHFQQFWTLIGLASDVVDLLCELEMVFYGGRICISNTHDGSTDLLEKISTILLRVWGFVGLAIVGGSQWALAVVHWSLPSISGFRIW